MTTRPEHLHVYAAPWFSNTVAPLPSTALDRWALGCVQRGVAGAPIRFVLWDGYERTPGDAPPIATIVIRNRRALASWLWDPELNFGEAYMFGAVDIRGDLVTLLEAVYRAWPTTGSRRWRFWQAANDIGAAKENVHRHYDLGNDFYRLWLDPELAYTCAYFPTPGTSLAAAQVAKMDLVCRKLRLTPGDRVVEAGCGWGSLALFMARCYGVRVRAFNISAEQIAYARERAAREDLAGRVEFVEDDYREVHGQYDAFVSVGMLEHVGLPDYPTLGRVMDRVLTADGRALLHFIGRNQPAPVNPWIRRRIFPGSYVPALREVFEHVLEPRGFSVLDVENLRLHYAATLGHWRRGFERAAGEVRAMFDEPFVRAWRLYLAGSEASFTTGAMQLFQIVVARGASNAIPWTRVSG